MKKKSHNQKIHDAHVVRIQEKQAAKQVPHFSREKNLFIFMFYLGKRST
jgi:hypothetical protein